MRKRSSKKRRGRLNRSRESRKNIKIQDYSKKKIKNGILERRTAIDPAGLNHNNVDLLSSLSLNRSPNLNKNRKKFLETLPEKIDKALYLELLQENLELKKQASQKDKEIGLLKDYVSSKDGSSIGDNKSERSSTGRLKSSERGSSQRASNQFILDEIYKG